MNSGPLVHMRATLSPTLSPRARSALPNRLMFALSSAKLRSPLLVMSAGRSGMRAAHHETSKPCRVGGRLIHAPHVPVRRPHSPSAPLVPSAPPVLSGDRSTNAAADHAFLGS